MIYPLTPIPAANKGSVARAEIKIRASVSSVWNALVDPEMIRKYMLGTEVVSEWKEGSSIAWKGNWKGKSYEDKGSIITVEHERMLQYTHFSPLEGLADSPDAYHLVTYKLSKDGDYTLVSVTQDNNSGEKVVEHSQKMWESILEELRKILE